eukprot:TRINITY_DN74024_c0_g1_i1.p1 TRINITY_DN74024_c0_g1~~TRINITY_DN74024_c0_g1_i1.p1  ORF type:complete len:415 (+),score=46.89 TRINITY_DN74024_c0_g1_i1:45-1289(+)
MRAESFLIESSRCSCLHLDMNAFVQLSMIQVIHAGWQSQGLRSEPARVLISPSVEEVRQLVGLPGSEARPLVLSRTGLVDDSIWTPHTLASLCGSRPIRGSPCLDRSVRMNIRKSGISKLQKKEFGGLEKVSLQELDKLNIHTIKDLLQSQRKGKGESLYLHDASIATLCPDLGKRLKVPKFFLSEVDVLFNLQERCPPSHPALFVGRKGSRTMLHVDFEHTRFWMAILQGRKRWQFVHPDDRWRLYPTAASEAAGERFQVDLLHPNFTRWPLLEGLRVLTAETGPDDIMFVPETWAHQVENIEDTVAYTINYVDEFNFAGYLETKWLSMAEMSYPEDKMLPARNIELFRNKGVQASIVRALRSARKKTDSHWPLMDFWKFWRAKKWIDKDLRSLMAENDRALKAGTTARGNFS